MKKHFVKFLSVGTFVSEETTKNISSWNVGEAIEMSKKITERYGSKPYGFYFYTKERNEDDFDSKITSTSHMYFINGTVKTLEDVKNENNPDNRILIRNMECNKWDRIVSGCNPWRWTQVFEKDDVNLNVE
jgi:hypothetical protein